MRLRDLGSANGTVVDGRRVEEALLEGGEDVRIGDVALGGHARAAAGAGANPCRSTSTPCIAATPSMVRRLVDQGRAGRAGRRWPPARSRRWRSSSSSSRW